MPLVGFRKMRDHVYLHDDGWSVDLRPARADAEAYGRYSPGLNHVGLRVADAKTVLAVSDAFAKRGFEAPPPQVFDNVETAVFFRDPDGVRWEVSGEMGENN